MNQYFTFTFTFYLFVEEVDAMVLEKKIAQAEDRDKSVQSHSGSVAGAGNPHELMDAPSNFNSPSNEERIQQHEDEMRWRRELANGT